MKVEVDETFDANVNVDMDEIIENLNPDDLAEILFEMGKEGRASISKFFSVSKQSASEYEGIELKRHLCDIIGVAYTTPVNSIISELVYRLNN